VLGLLLTRTIGTLNTLLRRGMGVRVCVRAAGVCVVSFFCLCVWLFARKGVCVVGYVCVRASGVCVWAV